MANIWCSSNGSGRDAAANQGYRLHMSGSCTSVRETKAKRPHTQRNTHTHIYIYRNRSFERAHINKKINQK